jgi:hypothetical protein
MYEINLIKVFPDLTIILQSYMTLPTTSCEDERNVSELSIIIKKIEICIKHARGKSELSLYPLYRKYYKIVVI